MRDETKRLLVVICALLAFSYASYSYVTSRNSAPTEYRPLDDCDSDHARCGLVVRRDALTGCEYLVTWIGGIVPRYDRDGGQICRDKPGDRK